MKTTLPGEENRICGGWGFTPTTTYTKSFQEAGLFIALIVVWTRRAR
jgi:hypothetical protein